MNNSPRVGLLTLITGIIAINTPLVSVAQTPVTLQNLANGNHLLCSQPPQPQQNQPNDGYCFLLRKTNKAMIGYYYSVASLGEKNICLTGQMNRNTLTGSAYQASGEGDPIKPQSINTGNQFTYWDTPNSRLQIRLGSPKGTLDQYGFLRGYVHYRSMILNLNQMYVYPNSGQPPTRCF